MENVAARRGSSCHRAKAPNNPPLQYGLCRQRRFLQRLVVVADEIAVEIRLGISGVVKLYPIRLFPRIALDGRIFGLKLIDRHGRGGRAACPRGATVAAAARCHQCQYEPACRIARHTQGTIESATTCDLRLTAAKLCLACTTISFISASSHDYFTFARERLPSWVIAPLNRGLVSPVDSVSVRQHRTRQ